MKIVKDAVAPIAIFIAASGVSLAYSAAPAQIVVLGEDLFTESITSAVDGSVIIGSIGGRTIFRAEPGSPNAEAWILSGAGGMASVIGVFADDLSETLWACSAFVGPPGDSPSPPSALYAFELKTGVYKSHYPLPSAGGFCNDIAIGTNGTVFVTDTTNMEVLRLKKGDKALEVWAGNGAFGPTGGLLDGIAVLGERVLVNTLATSKLFSVAIGKQGKAETAVELKLDRALDHPDGMRSFGESSLLLVESGGAGRLSKVTISENSCKVAPVKEGYPDGPVAVTVVGTTAYVLEGQLGAMHRSPGHTSAPPKPFKATAVEVGKP